MNGEKDRDLLRTVKTAHTSEEKVRCYDRAMAARPDKFKGMNLEAVIRQLADNPVRPKVHGFVEVYEEDFDGHVFQAEFRLPDDGTPGDGRFLVIRVEVVEGPVTVRLSTREQSGSVQQVGEFVTHRLDTVDNLLYPVTRIVTTQRLVPK